MRQSRTSESSIINRFITDFDKQDVGKADTITSVNLLEWIPPVKESFLCGLVFERQFVCYSCVKQALIRVIHPV